MGRGRAGGGRVRRALRVSEGRARGLTLGGGGGSWGTVACVVGVMRVRSGGEGVGGLGSVGAAAAHATHVSRAPLATAWRGAWKAHVGAGVCLGFQARGEGGGVTRVLQGLHTLHTFFREKG